MGSDAEEISELVRACDERAEIAAIELNMSCPNVKTGLDIGADPIALRSWSRAVRAHGKAADREADAQHGRCRGLRAGCAGRRRRRRLADQHAQAAALAPRRSDSSGGRARAARGWLGGGSGGLSGPAIRAVALAQIAAVAARVRIPVVGMGGVQSGTACARADRRRRRDRRGRHRELSRSGGGAHRAGLARGDEGVSGGRAQAFDGRRMCC